MATSTRDLGFVHRYVPGAGPAARITLLLLHGTGGNEHDLLELGGVLLPGANRLSPRGRVLERGVPRFFRRIAEGVFDLEDLSVRTDELAEFLKQAAAEYQFDPGGIVAVGYSNGANIAGSVLLKHPAALAGGVLLRPMVPFEPNELPALSGKRVFIAAGEMDSMVPRAGTERLAELLRASGADVTVEWQAAGHDLTAPEIDRAREWLGRTFGAQR